jgi:hypothetical protein
MYYSCLSPIPDMWLGVEVVLPVELVLHNVDLPVPTPHKRGVQVGRNTGEADGQVLGVAGLRLLVDELPVLATCTCRVKRKRATF